MSHFDSEGAENLLYEMRFLAVTKRTEPAKYIVANNLDARVRPGHTLACASTTSCPLRTI